MAKLPVPVRLYAAIYVATLVGYVSFAFAFGTLTAPPELGDGQDYDAIAFNLWKHRGFGFDWTDSEWRKPYVAHARYKPVLDRHSSFHLTAYRPPAMPYLLALVYSVAGRNFEAWRIVNCAIMAGAVTIASAIAARFSGVLAAVLCAMLSLLNPPLVASSQRFLTEGLACFFVALLAWLWLTQGGKTERLLFSLKIGLILGLLVSSRSIFLFWVPFVAIAVGRSGKNGRDWNWRPGVVFLVSFLLIIGPWWVRNILVTGAFMPFGTEGAINLPAGFGPRAIESRGLWAPNDGDGVPELEAQNLAPLDFEVRLAKIRFALTAGWMRRHPLEVVRLMVLHVWQELRPRRRWTDLLFPAAAIAAFLLRKSAGVGVLALCIGVNILTVALTWSVEGRFMVPVNPLMIALVAAMGAGAIRVRTE